MNGPGTPGGSPGSQPLRGRSIVVTRATDMAAEFARLLEPLGATTIEAPCIATEPPSDGGSALVAAARDLDVYTTVVLTSPTGARRFLAALPRTRGGGGTDRRGPHRAGDLEPPALIPPGLTVAAIGPGTSAVLAEAGLRVEIQPRQAIAESLLEALGAPPAPGAQLLLARAEVGRDVLPDGLGSLGWSVDVVPAYRTVTPPPDAELAARVAQADAVTFTSSSTVTGFLSRFGLGALPPRVACIGPICADTAREAGMSVDAAAEPHTLAGLTDALVALLAAT